MANIFRDDDLPRSRDIDQTGGDVYRIADGGVLHALRGADVADYGGSGVKADADADASVEPRGLALHIDGRLNGALGIAVGGDRRAEQRHDAVADIFIERAAGVENHAGHGGEKFIQQQHDFARVEMFGHFREVADVGEQDGDGLEHPAELDASSPVG